MSDTRRQGNIVLMSLAVLALFAVSHFLGDPADGDVGESSQSHALVDEVADPAQSMTP